MIGEIPELTAEVIEMVRKVCPKPVLVKLPGLGVDYQDMLQSCAEAGATGVSGINSLPALGGIDLETLEPRPSVHGHSSYGGLSGPAIKPVALRAVSLMARNNLLPVSGIGGIESWQDAAEFLLLGASTVQICTAVMWRGYGIINGLLKGLRGYMLEKGWSELSQLIGRANVLIEPNISHLDAGKDLMITIVPDLCNNCGLCVIACRDGGYQAIAEGTNLPLIDLEKCDSCGLCQIVCPHGAIMSRYVGTTG